MESWIGATFIVKFIMIKKTGGDIHGTDFYSVRL